MNTDKEMGRSWLLFRKSLTHGKVKTQLGAENDTPNTSVVLRKGLSSCMHLGLGWRLQRPDQNDFSIPASENAYAVCGLVRNSRTLQV